MRLAVIAAAAPSGTAMPSLGERDAILIRDRLAMEDLGFEVRVADATEDLAEQLGAILDEHAGRTHDVLLYASSLVAVADEEECFLCLDPSQVDVGDSLRDLADELYEHAALRTIIVLEARYQADYGLDDAQMAEYVLGSVVSSVDCERTGIEVIAAVRPVGVHDERIPSRLTAALLETTDAGDEPLTAEDAFATVRRVTDFGPWPHASVHVPGVEPFSLRYDEAQRAEVTQDLVPPADDETEPAAETEPEEPAATESEGEAPPTKPDRFPERRPAPPSERVEVASIGLHERKAALPDRDSTKLPKVILSPSLRPPPRRRAQPPPPPKHRRRRSRRSAMRLQPPTAAELAAAQLHPEPHPALAGQSPHPYQAAGVVPHQAPAPVAADAALLAQQPLAGYPPGAQLQSPYPGGEPADEPSWDSGEAVRPEAVPPPPAVPSDAETPPIPPSVPPEAQPPPSVPPAPADAPASVPPAAAPPSSVPPVAQTPASVPPTTAQTPPAVPPEQTAAAATAWASAERPSDAPEADVPVDEDEDVPIDEDEEAPVDEDEDVPIDEDEDVPVDAAHDEMPVDVDDDYDDDELEAEPIALIRPSRPAADLDEQAQDLGSPPDPDALLAAIEAAPEPEPRPRGKTPSDSPEIETSRVEVAEIADAYFAAEVAKAEELARLGTSDEPRGPAPISTPPSAPVSTPPSAPVSTPPSAPVSTPPAAPVSTPPSAPVSTPPAAPVSTPPSATTLSSPPASGPGARAPGEMSADEWLVEGNLAMERGELAQALTFYKKGLGKLGTQTVPLRAEIYVRVAEVVRLQGKPRVAISNYDKALAIEPSDLRALLGSIELNAEQGNWRAVRAAEERYFQLLDDPAVEYRELMASGLRWLEDSKDVAQARQRFEDARDAFTDRVRPLEQLLRIYEREGTYELALQTRHRLLELTTEPGARADGYYELGKWCIATAHMPDEAIKAFELALEANPSRLDVLEVLATALADNQEWAELERIYRKMVALIEEMDVDARPGRVVAAILHRLALLYRDHLEDSPSALNAIDKALRNHPHNLAGQLLAADLADELGDPERAFRYLGKAAIVEPRRTDTYHRIFEVAQHLDHAEMGFLAASVTCLVGAQTDDERITFHKFRPETVPHHTSALEPQGWDWLRDPNADPTVAGVMRALAAPVLRMRVQQLETEGKLPDLPPEAQHDPEGSTISAVRSVGWASQLLGVPAPAIYVNEEVAGSFVAPFARHHAVMAGSGALRGRSVGELAFLTARHLALRLPDFELVAHLRSVEELTACFLAALDLVLDTGPASGELGSAVQVLTTALEQTIRPEEREALTEAVSEFEGAGGRVSLTEWLGSVERTATRTGFLLCGDLEIAARVIQDDSESAFLDAAQRIEDLCAFAVSDENVKLRVMLGCTLSGAE